MTDYLATFHTHLAALKTHRAMTAAGLTARMAPVPRKISSSCGTCVFYRAGEPRQPYAMVGIAPVEGEYPGGEDAVRE